MKIASKVYLVDEGWFEYKDKILSAIESDRAENLLRKGVVPDLTVRNKKMLRSMAARGEI